MPVPEKEFERPKGAPMWVVTFTDMISLLLTFFIMILTFSSMEEEKLQQATGSLAGAFGVMSKPGMPPRTETSRTINPKFKDRDRDGVTDPSIRKKQVKDAVKKIQDRKMFNIKISLQDTRDGTLIKLEPQGDNELFTFGTMKVADRTKMLLKEIARMFKELPVRVVIEVHTDSATPDLLDMDSRILTQERGLSAAKVLLDEGFTPERVGIQPRGDFFPVAPNDKPLGRFKNRRLEIHVLPTWRDEIIRDLGDN